MARSKSLLQKTSHIDRLHSAWRVVYQSGLKSSSIETRNLVKAFYVDAPAYLRKIRYALSRNKYKFSPAKGVLKKKGKRNFRPLVVATVSDRIVQRALLDTIYDSDLIQKKLATPFSFGGIKDGGVRKAIDKVCKEIDLSLIHI